MNGRLFGKVALVTGAATGIGAAIASAFHTEGARVALLDISGRESDEAARLGSGALAVHADVTKGSDLASAIAEVVSIFGRLDILCNNAGIDGEEAMTADCSEENYDRVMAVNARGVFLGMRYGIPAMLANGGGSIINTSSIAGNVAFPRLAPYCASKGAVLMMTKTVAVEYASQGIRVNAICPGVVDTELVRQMSEDIITAAKSMTPMARVAGAEEIAQVAVFLASDESSFVTGTSITADGGYTAL